MKELQKHLDQLMGRILRDGLADAFQVFCDSMGSHARYGGAIVIAITREDFTEGYSLTRTFGSPGFKFANYSRNANEKVARLLARQAGGHPDVASSQSADPNNPDERLRTYGGAVAFTTSAEGIEAIVYVSISGGPPENDEAMSLALGQRLGLEVIRGFDNPLAKRAFAASSNAVSDRARDGIG